MIARGEGEEDVAAGVEAETAHPGKAHAGALREATALKGQQRGICGEHHDDRALWLRVSRPTGERSPYRNAVHAKMAQGTIVRLDERANHVCLRRGRNEARRRADASFEPVTAHSGAAPDIALRDRAGACAGDRFLDMFRRDVKRVDIVEP